MVEKNPKKDISLTPKWPILIDGLGYGYLLVEGMPSTDRDGREIITLVLKTDEVSRKRYNLTCPKDVDENGYAQKIILRSDLIDMNPFDEANKKWLYVKGFHGEKTNISEREKELKYEIERLKRAMAILDADNIRLNEQLELAKLQPQKFIKQGAEVFQESAKAFSELMRKDKE